MKRNGNLVGNTGYFVLVDSDLLGKCVGLRTQIELKIGGYTKNGTGNPNLKSKSAQWQGCTRKNPAHSVVCGTYIGVKGLVTTSKWLSR